LISAALGALERPVDRPPAPDRFFPVVVAAAHADLLDDEYAGVHPHLDPSRRELIAALLPRFDRRNELILAERFERDARAEGALVRTVAVIERKEAVALDVDEVRLEVRDDSREIAGDGFVELGAL
jgi:hypothetical protein